MMPHRIRIKLRKTHDKEKFKSSREDKATRLRGTKISIKADLPGSVQSEGREALEEKRLSGQHSVPGPRLPQGRRREE